MYQPHKSQDSMDNPNLAGGPIGGSDIAVYKVKTAFKLGGLHAHPYALPKEDVELLDTFTNMLDATNMTNSLLRKILEQADTDPENPISKSDIRFILKAFSLNFNEADKNVHFGENWASKYYSKIFRNNIWPACFPRNYDDYPRNDDGSKNLNALTVGWLDQPPLLKENVGEFLEEHRNVFLKQIYKGHSRVRSLETKIHL